MIELLKEKIKPYTTLDEKYNVLRENLHYLILKVLDEQGYSVNLAFVGGTALRIIYKLNRYSEDLDFCLVNPEGYSFEKIIKTLEHELSIYNIKVSTKYKDKKTVASAFIKFENLLDELSLAKHKDQKLLIKFEVDQNPPQGYNTMYSMVNWDYLLGINHFDLSSLFSGKLHAVLCRKYAKGRDFYDLLWYINKEIQPNLKLLEAALLQTEDEHMPLSNAKLIDLLKHRLEQVNLRALSADVAPFLEDQGELRFFEYTIFSSLIEKIGS